MRSIIAIAAASALASVAAVPAAGSPPSQTGNTFSWSYTGTSMCGFAVDVAGSVDIVTTTFYDNAGAPVRTFTVNRAEGSFMAQTTGRVAQWDQAMNVTHDLATNTATATGVTTRVTGDGGIVLLGVGRAIWQFAWPEPATLLFEAGQSPHGFDPATYNGTICNYLAGP